MRAVLTGIGAGILGLVVFALVNRGTGSELAALLVAVTAGTWALTATADWWHKP